MRRRWRSGGHGVISALRSSAVVAAAGAAIAATMLSLVLSRRPGALGGAFAVASGGRRSSWSGAAELVSGRYCDRPASGLSRVTRHWVPPEQIYRHKGEDYSARWNYRQRSKTRSPEEAEQILMRIGRLPRPLRTSAVELHKPPITKTIVANENERRKIAQMNTIYAVTKLQARVMLKREHHPVWQHERVMLYGKMWASYIQPCPNTNEPMEMSFPLKFKAAFREDRDPYFKTIEQKWEEQMDRTNSRPDLVEGKKIEELMKKTSTEPEVPENLFSEAILDNVLDIGEVVLQHFACHVDKQATGKGAPKNEGKYARRLGKRLKKEYGADFSIKTQDIKPPYEGFVKPTPQELHDACFDDITKIVNKKSNVI